MKPFGTWFAESAQAARGDVVIPLKEPTPADFLVGALQEIEDMTSLDCGCMPCRGQCWDKAELRDLVLEIRDTAQKAIKKHGDT